MKKVLLAALAVFVLCGCGKSEAASLSAKVETDIQINKEYDMDILNAEIATDMKSQSYLLAVDAELGALTLTPKVGVFNSVLDINEMVELKNELGFVCGLDAEYQLAEVYEGLVLSAIGRDLLTRFIDIVNTIPTSDADLMKFLKGAHQKLDLHQHQWEVIQSLVTSKCDDTLYDFFNTEDWFIDEE